VAIAARYKGYRYPIEVIGHAVLLGDYPKATGFQHI